MLQRRDNTSESNKQKAPNNGILLVLLLLQTWLLPHRFVRAAPVVVEKFLTQLAQNHIHVFSFQWNSPPNAGRLSHHANQTVVKAVLVHMHKLALPQECSLCTALNTPRSSDRSESCWFGPTATATKRCWSRAMRRPRSWLRPGKMRRNQSGGTKTKAGLEGGDGEWDQRNREEDETKCASSSVRSCREGSKRQDRRGGATKNRYQETKRTLLRRERREGKGKSASGFERLRSCWSS